jgi:transposase
MAWAREWAKDGMAVDWQELLPPKGFLVLPRRWVVERTIAWIEKNSNRLESQGVRVLGHLQTVRSRIRALRIESSFLMHATNVTFLGLPETSNLS